MKRPANGGKGLDGVVERAPGYDNPAILALDAGAPKPAQRHTASSAVSAKEVVNR
jgi:beta-lysine 5,6-aminomutase alpha subunit